MTNKIEKCNLETKEFFILEKDGEFYSIRGMTGTYPAPIYGFSNNIFEAERYTIEETNDYRTAPLRKYLEQGGKFIKIISRKITIYSITDGEIKKEKKMNEIIEKIRELNNCLSCIEGYKNDK